MSDLFLKIKNFLSKISKLIKTEEKVFIKWEGEWSDTYLDKDGNVLHVTPWKPNKVVQGAASVLASGLFGSIPQIKFLGIGHGDVSWDTSIPPVGFGDILLDNEYFRKAPESIKAVFEQTGTATSGTVTTLIDTSLTETTDDFYKFLELKIVAGANSGESRLITAYDGTTKEITVQDAFSLAIDNTSEYEINVPTTAETNKVEIQTRFKFSDSGADGTIREMGLFGGQATSFINTGTMMNAIRHAKIEKDGTDEIVRRIRIKVVIQEV